MKPMMGRNHDSMGASISWVVKSIHCSTCPCMSDILSTSILPCMIVYVQSTSFWNIGEGTQAKLDHTASKVVVPKRPLSAILATYRAMALLSNTPPWGVSSVGTCAVTVTSRGVHGICCTNCLALSSKGCDGEMIRFVGVCHDS